PQHVGAQGLQRVVGTWRAIAIAVAAAVHCDHVITLRGQDLPSVLPREPVLAAAVQHQDRGPPVCRRRVAFHFVCDKPQIMDAAKRHCLGCAAHRTHASRRESGVFIRALEYALVPPRTRADADERADIIEAAYACLSAPHEAPVSVAAILDGAGLSTRAFYRHFASKDELFLAMLKRDSDAVARRLQRPAED